MKAKISAIAILLVIFFQLWPQQSGKSQLRKDSVLSLENQVLFKIRDEILDSINVKTARTFSKLEKIDVKKEKCKTVIIIHDTVYLPFWHSLFKRKK